MRRDPSPSTIDLVEVQAEILNLFFVKKEWTTDEILRDLQGRFGRKHVLPNLRRLKEKGYLFRENIHKPWSMSRAK